MVCNVWRVSRPMLTKAVLFAPGDRHESPTPSPHALKTPSQRLAMLPVGNQPLVRHALDELANAGVTDVAVVSEPDVAEEVEQVLGEWPAGRCETGWKPGPSAVQAAASKASIAMSAMRATRYKPCARTTTREPTGERL